MDGLKEPVFSLAGRSWRAVLAAKKALKARDLGVLAS
jgi:hypothetical protein